MICESCGVELHVGDWPYCPHGKGESAVIGDECDFVQENGTHHPIRFTHWSDYRRWLKQTGQENLVRHTTIPGTDKSPHTVDWSRGIDAYTLAAAAELTNRNGSFKGNDPPMEPLQVKWQVRDVHPQTGPSAWRDVKETP